MIDFLFYREFALKIKRPFAIRYNPYNQSIEILSNAQQVSNIVSDLKGDICIIFDALKKLEDSQNSNTNEETLDTNYKNVNGLDPLAKAKNLKLKRQYKKLEEAFKDLSIDLL